MRACRRASTFVDVAPSAGVRGRRLEIAPRGRAAEGLAIEIAPCGRAAEGLAMDIAPCGRAAEGLAIEIAPWGRAAGRPPSWTSPCPPGTSPHPLRHMEDAMRCYKLVLCLYLVWTTDEQDASAPASASARPPALQRRFMKIEHLFRYPARAVGLKPSARQGKARLRRLYRNNYSKTINRACSSAPASAGARPLALQGRFQSRPRFR